MTNATQIRPRKRVERVVWELGGGAAIANALGISRAAVFKWEKRDSIPSGRQSALLALARDNGIELKAEDLIG